MLKVKKVEVLVDEPPVYFPELLYDYPHIEKMIEEGERLAAEPRLHNHKEIGAVVKAMKKLLPTFVPPQPTLRAY